MRPGTRRASAFAFATFFLTLALAGSVEWRHRRDAAAALEGELRRAAEQLAPEAARLLALPVAEADAEIRRWAAASGMRVTLIAHDGRVIVDSWTLPALLDRLENHGTRPEIQAAARDARVAIARRRSVSTDQRYRLRCP